jgi:hypothetical protein
MKTQTKVLNLAAIAALAFLGAWLIPEPTLRPLDLASVRGGDPPPCTHQLYSYSCNDLNKYCSQQDGSSEVQCEGAPLPRYCQTCSGSGTIKLPTQGQTLDFRPTTVTSVNCGVYMVDARCVWNPNTNKCYCVGVPDPDPIPVSCELTSWNSVNCK